MGVRYGKFNFAPIVINLEFDNTTNNSQKVKSYPEYIMVARIFCLFTTDNRISSFKMNSPVERPC